MSNNYLVLDPFFHSLAELAPDLSYQKAKVDVSKVDEYQIAYPGERLEDFFNSHILAHTLPQSLEEDLSFDVEVRMGFNYFVLTKRWKEFLTTS